MNLETTAADRGPRVRDDLQIPAPGGAVTQPLGMGVRRVTRILVGEIADALPLSGCRADLPEPW